MTFFVNEAQMVLVKRRVKRKIRNRPLREGVVSVVVISAGRREYLRTTLESLRRYWQYSEGKTDWYIIDDCPTSRDTRTYIESLDGFDLKLSNDRNYGLGYTLNRVYAELDSEFVFHCEDDWEFLRPIPVHRLIERLRAHPELRQMLLFREPLRVGERPMARPTSDGYAEFDACFSLNPHIARTSLFRANYPFPLSHTEGRYTRRLARRGWKLGGIYDHGGVPFMRHIGETRRVDLR